MSSTDSGFTDQPYGTVLLPVLKLIAEPVLSSDAATLLERQRAAFLGAVPPDYAQRAVTWLRRLHAGPAVADRGFIGEDDLCDSGARASRKLM